MATIESHGSTASEVLIRAELRGMTDSEMMVQQLIQQGGIDAVAFLLKQGANEQTAAEMLASLRQYMAFLRHEARRRGVPDLFPDDQTDLMQ